MGLLRKATVATVPCLRKDGRSQKDKHRQKELLDVAPLFHSSNIPFQTRTLFFGCPLAVDTEQEETPPSRSVVMVPFTGETVHETKV